jgi:hypothetical protein
MRSRPIRDHLSRTAQHRRLAPSQVKRRPTAWKRPGLELYSSFLLLGIRLVRQRGGPDPTAAHRSGALADRGAARRQRLPCAVCGAAAPRWTLDGRLRASANVCGRRRCLRRGLADSGSRSRCRRAHPRVGASGSRGGVHGHLVYLVRHKEASCVRFLVLPAQRPDGHSDLCPAGATYFSSSADGLPATG